MNLPTDATKGAGGVCGKHGLYDGLVCPGCAAKREPSRWRPLGFRRTLRFLFSRRSAGASWRHFGWELNIERTPGSLDIWIHRRAENSQESPS